MNIFIARQPIFDREKNVYAYELLFRSSLENKFTASNIDQATSQVIVNAFSVIGLGKLTGGKKAFIKFTPKLIEEEIATILPKEVVAVAIRGDVKPDDNMLKACTELRDRGYTIVLEKMSFGKTADSLIELASIIKVDFLEIKEQQQRQEIATWAKAKSIKLIAEKIESEEEHNSALAMNYSFLQGNFFCKPYVISSKGFKGLSINSLRLLEETNKAEVDFNEIEKLIRMDVSLTYKLLKFINSAYFNFSAEISSIKQALVMLGKKEIRKWISLIILQELKRDKPDELIVLALSRARFCEGIAPFMGMENRKEDLFFMGLFSLIDAFLDQPMVSVLMDLPIKEDIKSALLGNGNELRKIYEIMSIYEKGNFELFTDLADNMNIPKSEVADIYLNSLDFASRLTN